MIIRTFVVTLEGDERHVQIAEDRIQDAVRYLPVEMRLTSPEGPASEEARQMVAQWWLGADGVLAVD